MDHSPELYCQVTYQYEHSRAPIASDAGTPRLTLYLHNLRKAYNEIDPLTPFQPPKNRPEGFDDLQKTGTFPAVRPGEAEPTSANVSVKNSDVFEPTEIQLKYGASNHVYFVVALRFDEKGKATDLVYDPMGDSEQVINPHDARFGIYMAAMKQFLVDCSRDEHSCRGRHFEGIRTGAVDIDNDPVIFCEIARNAAVAVQKAIGLDLND